MRMRYLLCFVLPVTTLAACGGGGGGGNEANDNLASLPATPANSIPVISSDSSVLVTENTLSVLDVSASDDDGDALSFSLSGDDAALFTISESGVLTFVTAPDFEAPTDSDADNVYDVTVSVSDGSGQAQLEINAEVTNDTEDDFQLAASAFVSGSSIPLLHTCGDLGGSNYSPQLNWENTPSGTTTLALIIDDETAPCGTDANACVHWNLFNIDASITALVEDVDPATLVNTEGFSQVVEGLNYAGTNNYAGPCPPAGNSHVYYFVLYALSADQPTMTRLDALTRSEFEEAYTDNILGQAVLTGTFSQ